MHCTTGGTKRTARPRGSLSIARSSLRTKATMRKMAASMVYIPQSSCFLNPHSGSAEHHQGHTGQPRQIRQNDGPDTARQQHGLEQRDEVPRGKQVGEKP